MTSSTDVTDRGRHLLLTDVKDGVTITRHGRHRIIIDRPVFDQVAFEQTFVPSDDVIAKPETSTTKKIAHRLMQNCGCRETDEKQLKDGGNSSLLAGFGRKALGLVPVVKHLREYRWRKWLINDVVSGISTGVVHVPQGMGFALLAGLPPVYGLYTSVFPGIVYYLFGTSRHLSMGTMALTALMVGAVVNREVLAYYAGLGLTATSGNMTSMPGDVTASLSETGFAWSDAEESTHSSSADWTTSSPVSGNNDEENNYRVGVAMSVTLMAGLFQLLMYVCRLGVIATYMSGPFIGGFMTASSVQIIVAQIPFLLGIRFRRPTGSFGLPLTLVDVCRHLPDTNIAALITSLISIALLVIIKEVINERFKDRLKIPVPAELILVIIATTISYFAGLHDRYKLAVSGFIPTGLPAPRLPPFNGNPVGYIGDSITLAIIAFAIAISMAKMMAERQRYKIDVDQELLAYGLHNSISPFFCCFVSTQAPPRTLLHETTGCRSQLALLVATFVPLLVCLCIGPLFESLPIAALGSIVVVALLPLMRKAPVDLRHLWAVDRIDFTVWISTFAITTLVSVTAGLACGMGLAIVLIVVQGQMTDGTRLVQADGTEIYLETQKSKNEDTDKLASSIEKFSFEHVAISSIGERQGNGEPPMMKLQDDYGGVVACFKFGASICFANADRFRQQLHMNTVDPVGLAKCIAKQQKREAKKLRNSCGVAGNNEKNATCCISRNHRGEEQRQISLKLSNVNCDYKKNGDDVVVVTVPELIPINAASYDVPRPGVTKNKGDNDATSNYSKDQSAALKVIGVEFNNNYNGDIVNPNSVVRTVVVDCSSINHVDTTGLAIMKQVLNDYAAVQIGIALAGCNQGLARKLRNAGLVNQKRKFSQQKISDVLGEASNGVEANPAKSTGFYMYPTVHDAVLASKCCSA